MRLKAHILTLHLLILPGLALSADRSVIVGFKQRPSFSERALIHGARGMVRHTFQLIPAVVATLPEQEIEALKEDSKIAYVEEDAVYWAAADPLPDDEYGNSWGVAHIAADVAHAGGKKGYGVRVAVLDTGIDYTHEDLAGNCLGGYDFVFDDGDPFDDSYNSHGTHVAGIIAAEENGVGVVGVAPEAGLFAVKVMDGGGFGLVTWIIAGIEWAVLNGADVINMSFEGPDLQALRDACDEAYNAGVLLVAAGGNSLAGGGPVEYPAAYDSVIAVTATKSSDLTPKFAPIGPELELAAPGVGVLSTVAGGGYDSLSGTSQAAPHVTGTAALHLLSNTEDLNGDSLVNHQDVRLLLQRTAIDLGDPGKDDVYGHGLVSAAERPAGPDDMEFTLARTSGRRADDAMALQVSGLPYGIVITNHGLNKVAVDVFEGNVLRAEFSHTFQFGGKRRQKVFTWGDATGTDLDIVFTPYGKPGTYAEIVLGTDMTQISGNRRGGKRSAKNGDRHGDGHGDRHGDGHGGEHRGRDGGRDHGGGKHGGHASGHR